jgi:phosphatidylglycerol lysyltransferase
VIAYAGFAFFRPVIYRYRTLPRERALAQEIVERDGRSGLDYFKVWPNKSYFFSPSRRCFIAYSVGANFAIALSDPVGPPEEIAETISGFKKFCEDNGWGVAFYQTLPDFLPVYRSLSFKKLKIGDAAIVDLTSFTLEGRASKRLRARIKQKEVASTLGISHKTVESHRSAIRSKLGLHSITDIVHCAIRNKLVEP